MEPDRVAYSPIVERPRLKWPGESRVALWVCPNIEHYEYLPDPVRVRDPWPRVPHPDILGYGIEAGIKYYCDWLHDDQPWPMKVRTGRLLTVPYSMELNDAVLYNRPHEADDFAQMIKDHFDTVYREGAEHGRVMCIALHPYMMGQPQRLKHLDDALRYILAHDGVWQATGEEIADWYYAHAWDDVAAHLAAEA